MIKILCICLMMLCSVAHAESTNSKFAVVTTSDTAEFSFSMSAKGIFTIDWGDGNIETINRTDATAETYTHTYNSVGEYTIGFDGIATGYTSAAPSISFANNLNVSRLFGSLTALFPTLRNNSGTYLTVRFNGVFQNCKNLVSVPENLFAGDYYGFANMFAYTFAGCTSLQELPENLFPNFIHRGDAIFKETFRGCTSLTTIPADLFSGVNGIGYSMFSYTFAGCTNLVNIPIGLFASITGTNHSVFYHTFDGCGKLENIPENLFAGITSVGEWLFAATFSGCSNLKKIPEKLFSHITGHARAAFSNTFYGCSKLIEIPKDLFLGISGANIGMFENTFNGCINITAIPASLFSGVFGAAESMFKATFSRCSSIKSIPENLFAGVNGMAKSMFYSTFYYCSGLTSLPNKLFGDMSGTLDIEMFGYMFGGCSNLSGFVPDTLFTGLDNDNDKLGVMAGIFNATGLVTKCPPKYYQNITGFEQDWNKKVSCVPCPDEFPNSVEGATDVRMCYRGELRKLHVNKNTIGLVTYKTTDPALHVAVDGVLYYAAMTTIETNIMRNSINKLKIKYDDIIYYVYDITTIVPM